MSRYNPKRDLAPLLGAAQQWFQRCLIEQRSLFTDRDLWTPEGLSAVRSAFSDNPDAGSASFFEKLEGQLQPASGETRQLMAELLWVLMLFQSNIGPDKKRESVGRVWGWSGEKLDLEHPLFAQAVLTGVGSPGTAYNTQRWRELNYLIGLSIDLARRPESERRALLSNRDRFEQWIASAPQEGYRQFRHLFRYLAFPDQNERITLGRDRRQILAAYTDLTPATIKGMSDAAQDDALSALREGLKAQHGLEQLDFYEPQFADRWRSVPDTGQRPRVGTAFDNGFAILKERFLNRFPGFESFASNSDYEQEERGYKDELVSWFERTVTRPLAEGQWKDAATQAIKLLKRNLTAASNKPQNIVGWRYINVLASFDDKQLAKFGRALADLFDETIDVAPRVDRFLATLQKIVGEPIQAGAQRSITAFYLTLSDPSQHLFFKTEELQRVLRILEPDFQWTQKQLTGADVERVESIARELMVKLEAEGWQPRDLIDVQSFLWTAANNDGRVTEPTPEEEVMTEVESISPAMSRPPLNQILFGPPGTGKTYQTIDKALEILDPGFIAGRDRPRRALKDRFDELVTARRIRFVTFHQSFSYEDFVEGLRADNDDEGQLRYRVEPGVFRSVCDDARGSAVVASAVGIREGARIWKLSIDGTGASSTRDYCLAQGEARIGWGELGNLQDDRLTVRPEYKELGTNNRNTVHAFSNEIEPGDVVLCIGSITDVQAIGVVQGDYSYQDKVPAGVLSDYNNVLPVRWLATGLSLNLHSLNGGRRFTLKTVYEITRFGWPELAAAIDEAGIRLKGSVPARQEPQDHVLIIDEINRGNISRIFGELITLIEPSKRDGAAERLEVTLPYSKKQFSVPANVYLIGTMNTADRSLAGLDTALRRRFEFIEMPPQPKALAGVSVEGISLEHLLETLNRRIEVLLDRDHQLGHAYFMAVRNGDGIEVLARIFRNQVLPLLQEYFFEDWQRIAWVLNDHRKPEEFRFLTFQEDTASSLFGPDAEVPVGARLWRLNNGAFDKTESYRRILGNGLG